MSQRYEPRTTRLPTLLSEVMSGEITVPIFQREFVWTDEQRLELLDSVYRDRPFGALFLWRVQVKYPSYAMLGPVRILGSEKAPPFPQYIIDGMQRVTTLYAALAPGLYESRLEEQKGPRPGMALLPAGEPLVTAQAEDRRTRDEWETFFDAEDDGQPFKLRTARMRKSGRIPPSWVSTSVLFHRKKLNAILGNHDGPFATRDEYTDRVLSCRDTFNDYIVVLIPLVTADPEEAVTAFTRINRGGTPMDETALVHARVWQEAEKQGRAFNLRTSFERIRRSLAPYGFDDIGDATLLNSVILAAGKPVSALKHRDEKQVASLIATNSEDLLLRTERALTTAARFLDEALLVRGTSMLPSAWHILLLVVVADALNANEAALVQRVRRWFMATAYAGALSVNLRMQDELDHLRSYVIAPKDGVGAPRPAAARDAVDALSTAGRFDLRSSRNKAFALSLVHHASRYRPDDARRYARLLAQIGARALPRLVDHDDVNLPEARVLCDPSELPSLYQDLTAGPYEDVHALAEQHLVSLEAHAALLRGDLSGFLVERRRTLDQFEREQAREFGLSWVPDESIE